MRTLLVFLFIMFVVGGAHSAGFIRRRPVLILAFSFAVGAMYYSLRVTR